MLEIVAPALLIAALRIVDVSLGTLKTIFLVEGRKALAPTLGFFEATLFVIAAGLVFSDLSNPFKIVGYGAGFAIGTALGMVLAERIGLGSVTMRIISSADQQPLVDALREAGFRLTTQLGLGREGPVNLIMMIVRKKEIARALAVAQPWRAQSFITVGDEPLAVQPATVPGGGFGQVPFISQAAGLPWLGLGTRRPGGHSPRCAADATLDQTTQSRT